MRSHTASGAILVLLALQLLTTASAGRSLTQTRACACPLILSPVCGSDGKQHPNKCVAQCNGVTVTKELAFDPKDCPNIAVDPLGPIKQQQQPQQQQPAGGRQPLPAGIPPGPLNMNTNSAASSSAPCRCPKIYLPVCGSDGKLYTNKCLAECQQGVTATNAQPDANSKCPGSSNRRLQSTTSVKQPGRVCPCPRIYRPVCGSNGKQYDNECLAKCDHVAVVGEASGSGCASGPFGQSASGPVTSGSGTSGPVTSGPVTSGPARPTAQQTGPTTPQTSGPVVAEPRTAAAGSGPAVTVGQNLPQPSNPRQPVGRFGAACGCQLSYEPVCGKDAKWYPNVCSLNCAGVGLSAVRPDSYGNCLVG